MSCFVLVPNWVLFVLVVHIQYYMRKDRLENYKRLEALRKSKLLVYVTSDRQNAEANISANSLSLFANHLDTIGDTEKISLFLYSNGGNTLTGWSLVNLIRNYCKDFEVIIPFKCQSTATLISLGTDRIIMTRQATLGPIDPSINGPLNPQANWEGRNINVPIFIEHVNGFIEMAKEDLKIKSSYELKDIYLKLAEFVHPLSLGVAYKAKAQVKMLAEKLLKYHKIETANIPKVINFLCSESGSHDYTIYREEAKEELGLNIEKPDDKLYRIIKSIYHNIETELEMKKPFDVNMLSAEQGSNKYSIRRALIESVEGGCDVFISEGVVIKQSFPNGQVAAQIKQLYDSWKHEN